MPPYGTPPHPYVAMYPHGVYAHPSMPPVFSYPSASVVAHKIFIFLHHLTEANGLLYSNFNQGSYSFSPFAMPSPNGIAEASVSFSCYCVLYKFFPPLE